MDLELPSCSKQYITSKRQAPPTICAVCLGKATGHHYDVPSCNGCKTFFRRNTITNRGYICAFDNKCFDDFLPGVPLRKCKACRFKKCAEVGMNPMAIQNEERVEKPRHTIEAQVGKLIESMLRLDAQSEKFRDCAYNPESYPTLEECVDNERSVLSMADEYEPMNGWPLRRDQFDEFCKLRRTGKKHIPVLKQWRAYELLIQIELAKTLPFFSFLSKPDRFCLIRDTVLMSSNLTKAFYSFEHKSDRLIWPDGVRYHDIPFKYHDEFRIRIRDDIGMRCLGLLLRNGLDRVEFVLLRVLVLTNPAVPEISDDARQYLTKERQKYNIALFRYIMAQHGASGPARFANLLGFINVLEQQQKDQRDLGILMSLTSPMKQSRTMFNDVMKD